MKHWRRTSRRRKRTSKRIKRWLLVGAAIVAVCGAGVLAFLAYPKFNQERLVRRARGFLEAKNYQSAAITAQRVLQLNRDNVAATRIMVAICEQGKAVT